MSPLVSLPSAPRPVTRRSGGRRLRRRGMSIIVVLTIIMLAMAASYATLHTQSTMLAIAKNGKSRDTSRQTAQAAMSIGLRKMAFATQWAGADTNFSGTLGTGERYTVFYYTGITDADGTPILPNSTDATAVAEWPFCVTVVATGYCSSQGNGTSESRHRVRSVVRLAKPTLQTTPSNWSLVPYFSVIQWANSPVEMQLPARIEGWTYWQGGLDFFSDYPLDKDLRPFSGRIDEVAIYNKALSGLQITTINLWSSLGSQSSQYSGQNPIAWWKLDEGAGAILAADSAGSNQGSYDGAKSNATAAALHTGNKAAQFDGTNDAVHLGTLNVSGSGLTIFAWIRPDSLSDGPIVSKSIGTADDDQYWTLGIKSSKLRFRLKAGGTTADLAAGTGTLSTGTWTFVAATYDGSTMRLYKDGAEVASKSKTGTLDLNSNAPVVLGDHGPGSSRTRYFEDLRLMQQAGAGNVHPHPDYMFYPRSRTSSQTLALFDDDLQIPPIDMTASNASSFITTPSSLSTYQLYPGGKTYSVQSLDSTIYSASYRRNVQTNPLGIFYRGSSVTIEDSVTVEGSLITGDKVEVKGKSVNLQSVNVPLFDGTSATLQLPTVIANSDFKVRDTGGLTATGLIYTGNEFRVENGPASLQMQLQGKVVAKKFIIPERDEWKAKNDAWWRDRFLEFLAQLPTPNATNYSPYFPQWLNNTQALDPVPKITVKADSAAPTYHWHTFAQPIFTYNSSTATGMTWEIVAWDDGV